MPMKTPVRRGDIILVKLDGAQGFEKQNDPKINARPCLVVQNDGGNASSGMTIIVTITNGGTDRGYKEQVFVTAQELGPGGSDSIIECGQIRAISGDIRVTKHLGTLDPQAMLRVDTALRASLSL